jgi:hypothetical protein
VTTWYVASQNPGTSSFLDASLVAVNFWIRVRCSDRSADAIKASAAGQHPQWDSRSLGTKTNFARQLELFASSVAVGDHVISFDAARRDFILVGRVTSLYRYEDPPTIPDHPHVRDVEWLGALDRDALPDAGAAIAHTRGITVRHVSDVAVLPSAELDDAPVAPSSGRWRQQTNLPDRFEWEPGEGTHRYVLRQNFRTSSSAENPFVVIMLNPGANHMPGFRRSTTCHAVRRWGEAHGHDGAVYVNLFSHIEPNSARLCEVPRDALNGPHADAAIADISRAIDGVAIAGWGGLPSGFPRSLYDLRVGEVQRLFGRELTCLGFTRSGYPRHGRGWRPEDALVTLRVP